MYAVEKLQGYLDSQLPLKTTNDGNTGNFYDGPWDYKLQPLNYKTEHNKEKNHCNGML